MQVSEVEDEPVLAPQFNKNPTPTIIQQNTLLSAGQQTVPTKQNAGTTTHQSTESVTVQTVQPAPAVAQGSKPSFASLFSVPTPHITSNILSFPLLILKEICQLSSLRKARTKEPWKNANSI